MELSFFSKPQSTNLILVCRGFWFCKPPLRLLDFIVFYPSGPDAPELLSLLRGALSEGLPDLTSVHRHELARFLADTCVTRRRLLQAVVGGAANTSVTRLHLEVQLPPTPCPLAQVMKPLFNQRLATRQLQLTLKSNPQADQCTVLALQGTDVHEWERQRHRAELTSMLRRKEEELKMLRDGSRVTLRGLDVPEDERLDKEVRLTKGYNTNPAKAFGNTLHGPTSTASAILRRGSWRWFVQR